MKLTINLVKNIFKNTLVKCTKKISLPISSEKYLYSYFISYKSAILYYSKLLCYTRKDFMLKLAKSYVELR